MLLKKCFRQIMYNPDNFPLFFSPKSPMFVAAYWRRASCNGGEAENCPAACRTSLSQLSIVFFGCFLSHGLTNLTLDQLLYDNESLADFNLDGDGTFSLQLQIQYARPVPVAASVPGRILVDIPAGIP